MGNYHPHGDSAIYDALARMTQDWSLRVPLIDGQGNFGSMDPDPPASMRYTEARLARTAMVLLNDLDKDTVDFQPNYDASREERSEEHTSELQSLMRNTYDVFCLKQKKSNTILTKNLHLTYKSPSQETTN